MRLGLLLTLGLAAVVQSWATAPPVATSEPPPGSWFKTDLTPELQTMLFNSLKNVSGYASGVKDRLCVTDIHITEVQWVAGQNYRFTYTGCDVPKTLQKQSNQQSPTQTSIAKYLGQCPTDFARKCTGVFGTITVWKMLDKSAHVTEIIANPVDTPVPTTIAVPTPTPPIHTPPPLHVPPPPPTTTKPGPVKTGAYGPTPLTSELSTLLYTSLANTTLYASTVTPRVCIKSISLVESQVVAGKNYRFTTTACDVVKTLQTQQSNQQHAPITKYLGQCLDNFKRKCVEVNAVVVIYKRWDGKVIQVSSIDTTSNAGTVHAA